MLGDGIQGWYGWSKGRGKKGILGEFTWVTGCHRKTSIGSLKVIIPIRTFADWSDVHSCFLEVDLVVYCYECT